LFPLEIAQPLAFNLLRFADVIFGFMLRRVVAGRKLFLRRHCQHSGDDLKPLSSSSHISILLSDCTFGTIVVLEVILVT